MPLGPEIAKAAIASEILAQADEMERIINKGINNGETCINVSQRTNPEVQEELRRRYLAVGWKNVVFTWGNEYDTCGEIILES